MNFEEISKLFAQAGVIASSILGAAFVVVYHLRTRWWKSAIGRHMMSFMAGLTAIIALALISNFYPEMPGRALLRILCWTLIPALFGWRLVILLRVKHYDENGNSTK